jgi:hypothetical protein
VLFQRLRHSRRTVSVINLATELHRECTSIEQRASTVAQPTSSSGYG